MTLNDMSCLLHLPIEGMLLDHDCPVSRTYAVHIYNGAAVGDDVVKALEQVENSNGSHAHFSWLNDG